MKFKRVVILFIISSAAVYLGLIFSLIYFFDLNSFVEILLTERTLFAIKLSMITATAAALISLTIAIPTAYGLSRFDFFGKQFLDTVLELPMVVSPVALGAMILIFFNNPLGSWIQNNYFQFVFNVSGIILAQFITVLGTAVRFIKAVMDEIPYRYEKVARSLGSSPFRSFMTITLPLTKRGIAASAIFVWAKALGEFGATMTVAGTMAMKTETIPVAIFTRLANADIDSTVVLISVLIFVGLGTLYVVRLIWRKSLYV